MGNISWSCNKKALIYYQDIKYWHIYNAHIDTPLIRLWLQNYIETYNFVNNINSGHYRYAYTRRM